MESPSIRRTKSKSPWDWIWVNVTAYAAAEGRRKRGRWGELDGALRERDAVGETGTMQTAWVVE